MTTPYIPRTPGIPSPLYHLYNSVAQVVRLVPTFLPTGAMGMSWEQIADLADPYLGMPGQMRCRLDVGFIRPGKDAPPPFAAGRAPDRVAVCFFDPAYDQVTGLPLVKAGDRLVMIAGPITGTWEFRQVPEVAQDMIGASHIEAQVIEVSQALEPTSPTPFPGVQEPVHEPGQPYTVVDTETGSGSEAQSTS